MCTICVLHRVSPLAPVIIGANRDEFYVRETRPPQQLEGSRAIAGVDAVAGGSWMGATTDGFVAALTNQRQGGFADNSRASRGAAVAECLRLASTDAATEYLGGLGGGVVNPFNLIFGTAESLRCAYVRDDGVSFAEVHEGISVLPNDVLDSKDFPKAARARRVLEQDLDERISTWPAMVETMINVLGSHERAELADLPAPPANSLLDAEMLRELDALCVHTPHYGTRSFSLVALKPGGVARYFFADGPPCRTIPLDITGALDDL